MASATEWNARIHQALDNEDPVAALKKVLLAALKDQQYALYSDLPMSKSHACERRLVKQAVKALREEEIPCARRIWICFGLSSEALKKVHLTAGRRRKAPQKHRQRPRKPARRQRKADFQRGVAHPAPDYVVGKKGMTLQDDNLVLLPKGIKDAVMKQWHQTVWKLRAYEDFYRYVMARKNALKQGAISQQQWEAEVRQIKFRLEWVVKDVYETDADCREAWEVLGKWRRQDRRRRLPESILKGMEAALQSREAAKKNKQRRVA